MEHSLETLITACILKSVFDLEIINSKEKGTSFRCEMYGDLNKDVVMLSTGKEQNRLADIISFVDENYLEKNIGRVTPLLSPFGYEDEERFAYNPNYTLFSNTLCYPNETFLDESFNMETFLIKCQKICTIYTGDKLLQKLLDVLECDCSFISLSGGRQSVFETAKLRAGIATCVWFVTQGSLTKLALEKDYVLVCSLDFLGIKDFKFQKSNTCDIKSEMSASLYIDLFRENVLDDLFEGIGISRCNLIFSGGRHLHMFLPNTATAKELIAKNIKQVNDWLVKMFKLDLYVSYGMTSLNNLDIGIQREKNFYENTFIRIANQKAIIEARKYSVENINNMNSLNITKMHYKDFSKDFYGVNTYAISKRNEGIPIGHNRYILPVAEADDTNNYVRIYNRKNEFDVDSSTGISIWAQDITNDNIDLNKCENNQYGLLRFDIDDFKRFMFGIFSQGKVTNLPTYKMELSKHFALFLRRDLHILIRKYSDLGKKVYCVHEGADDAFVFAEINNLLQFTSELIKHYQCFTLNKISFSAGISLYDCERTFSDNASLAQKLMDKAKTIPNKGGVALLDESHVMKWEDFFIYAGNCENMAKL